MSEVNIPLLRKAVEWVEEQSKLPLETRQWDQDIYVLPEDYRVLREHHKPGCGTAYCVAGYIGSMVDPRFIAQSSVEGEDGEYLHVADVAEEALGLPIEHGLFGAEMTAEMIRERAEEIAGQKL